MLIRRCHRGPIAACLILLLLFMQAAVAAYACPQRDLPVSPHPQMEGCEGAGDRATMDSQHPLLCLADCEQNAQVSHASTGFDLPAPVLLPFVVAFLPAAAVAPGLTIAAGSVPSGQPPGWPPLYLRNRILRN